MGQNLNNQGCDESCCPLDLTPSGVMISHVHAKNEWMFSYRFMNMGMSDMLNGTRSVSDETIFKEYLMSSSNMRMNMHMLMAMYGLSNRITLMAMANYNTNSMNMKMMSGSSHNHGGSESMDNDMKSNGFSDTKIQGLFALMKNEEHQLIAIAGVSIPTGSIQKNDHESMYSNERLPYSMQLGSGTWDLLPGMSYLYQRGSFAYSAQVTGTVRTGYNSLGYKLGNEATFTTWAAYKWNRFISNSLRLEGIATDYIKGQDLSLYWAYEPAANTYNYGGKRAFAYLGFNFFFPSGTLPNTRLGAEYGLPLYQNLNGPQMKTGHILSASLSIAF